MDIAIVGGTGALGIGLALRFARVGHRVVIGSRSKERADACADGVRERIGGSAKVEGLLNAEAVDA
ncbi:MAG: NAD(P)-binding domain-containing protein, partial [Actinomycetota bacterium]|nr:NAD(P)-binding domain-containing protein [Actinomycetota bacterium]